LSGELPDHYVTLGLDRRCTEAQIRMAYRLLAKQLHPDVNERFPTAVAQTQALNAAYEVLSDAARRCEYDRALAAHRKQIASPDKRTLNLAKDVHLRIEEFIRGVELEVRVGEANEVDGLEVLPLIVPPDTAPGTAFRLPRRGSAAGGVVCVRVKVRPDFRFKVRGSDLCCDLKLSAQRAAGGGTESLRGATGNPLRIQIPPKAARGEIIRLVGEGLPKARGGRGDLLVRILYTPKIQIRRVPRR